MNPKVSVIVPVCGVEKYIERCARSLFEQTLDDIEYLFVNDCTPDGSMNVLLKTLEDYPDRRSQVKIINMERNSGLAAVRRRGMRDAIGEYQISCDSDDWVETDMYEKMYQRAVSTGADIVSCDFWFERENEGPEIYQQLDESNPRLHINNTKKEIWWSCWSRMVKRSLIVEHKIYPEPGMNMWEDVYTMVRAYFFADKVVREPHPFYHYYVRNGSLARVGYDESLIGQQVHCIERLQYFFKEQNFDASPFLFHMKRLVKNRFLAFPANDFETFRNCFPEVLSYYPDSKPLYRFVWHCLAKGNVLPYKVYSRLSRLMDEI